MATDSFFNLRDFNSGERQTLSSMSKAEQEFNAKLLCTVTSTDGDFNNDAPPKVGDQVMIDATESKILDLIFTNQKNIPIENPLLKKSHPDTAETGTAKVVTFMTFRHLVEFGLSLLGCCPSIGLQIHSLLMKPQTEDHSSPWHTRCITGDIMMQFRIERMIL